jgi:hypothetical protein
MSLTEFDFNINNYSLEEILTIFNMPFNFTYNDLKKAKQKVLKTHPDKSNLDSNVFLFYSKAYKMLYSIWEFKNKGDVDEDEDVDEDKHKCDKNKKLKLHSLKEDYSGGSNEENKLLLDNFLKKKDFNFNKWFNEEFEKNKIYDEHESKGYGSWLSSDDGLTSSAPSSLDAMHSLILDKKKVLRSQELVKKTPFLDDGWLSTTKSSVADLNSDAPESYDSGLFDTMAYQDLQKAYTVSVIPVTEDDYNSRHAFSNYNELSAYRNMQNQHLVPMTEEESKQYLNEKSNNEEQLSLYRAFKFQQQLEQYKEKSDKMWAQIKRIT